MAALYTAHVTVKVFATSKTKTGPSPARDIPSEPMLSHASVTDGLRSEVERLVRNCCSEVGASAPVSDKHLRMVTEEALLRTQVTPLLPFIVAKCLKILAGRMLLLRNACGMHGRLFHTEDGR